jgi:hypothetical protein
MKGATSRPGTVEMESVTTAVLAPAMIEGTT